MSKTDQNAIGSTEAITASSNGPLHSLDAHYYTDKGIFELEKQHALAHTWQFAGHASALEKAGDYFCFEIAGENLFCVRTKDDGIKGLSLIHI